MAARSKKEKKSVKPSERLRYEIYGILLMAFSAFILISLTASTGLLGASVLGLLTYATGFKGVFMVACLLTLLGGTLCYTRRRLAFNSWDTGIILFFLIALTVFHYILVSGQFLTRSKMIATIWQNGLQGNGGGLFGALLCVSLIYLFGKIGTLLVIIALSVIDLVLLTGVSMRRFLQLCGHGFVRGGRSLNSKISDFIFVEGDDAPPESPEQDPDKRDQQTKAPVIIDYNAEPAADEKEKITEETGMPAVLENRRPLAEPEILPATEYQLPPLTLLTPSLKLKSNRLNKEIIENVRILEETLESFGIKVNVSQVHRGPAITRYEIQPAQGVKVSKIVHLSNDIALKLAAQDVRIEAPIPGKSALGIEVPNSEISPVFLREMLESNEFQQSGSKLTVALGKDVTGNPIITDLMKMPHLLIAGATGSGKSVCLNTLICSILYKANPNEVKFLLIDPKRVELTYYNGIPHLLAPVVTDAKKAASALKWVVSEMENRYELFASMGVRDISRYNTLCESHEKTPYQPLPYYVVLIDELADLMMIAPVDVEDSICRLAQMARAAGIHLVIATQRPSVDVITGVIKANIPSRIAFAVSSQTDSRTILDLGGAEKLLGRGDMLFMPVGLSKPVRIQGALVHEKEVEEIVSFIVKQGQPLYVNELPEVEETAASVDDADNDLFREAAKMVIDLGHASTSFLQRRFRIGYSHAARIMDIMEEKGIVGPADGAKPRGILMSQEQFNRFYGK